MLNYIKMTKTHQLLNKMYSTAPNILKNAIKWSWREIYINMYIYHILHKVLNVLYRHFLWKAVSYETQECLIKHLHSLP